MAPASVEIEAMTIGTEKISSMLKMSRGQHKASQIVKNPAKYRYHHMPTNIKNFQGTMSSPIE
jgi:hypothetical protein